MLPTCGMNDTKLEVTENYEEAELSDVDDEVFVRGKTNGFRLEIYDTAKKPLMAPRKKQKDFDRFKNGGFHTEVRSTPPSLRLLCVPICYILVATFAMLGIIGVVAFLSQYIQVPQSLLRFWSKGERMRSGALLPCDTFRVEDVWVRKFPKLLTESAFRLLDVDADGVDDILLGFATGGDGYSVPEVVCDIYFRGQRPCFGGVIALSGSDGSELWRFWTKHEVFALNCNEDLNKDNQKDCLFAGRAAVFGALNGKDGSLLWEFRNSPPKNSLMNVYTPQFIRDLNEDGVPDIIAVHGGDPLADPGSKKRLSGRILLVSGKTGEILNWTETPDKAESYYSPQIVTGRDGADAILLGTGGETHAGALYLIPLSDIQKGHTNNARLLYKDKVKGVISTPVLTDLNGDGTEDILLPSFNSTVVAFDGISLKQLWNYTFPSSETYTTPTPGYWNEDNVPDFLVKYSTGPGFPLYFHAQTTILDGKTGEALIGAPLVDTIGSQASTPLIRVQGFGNDIFLAWTSNCIGAEGNYTQFEFKKGTNVHEQSRANLCKLRFGSRLINQLHAFNRRTGIPGALIYDSEDRRESEYTGAVNTSLEGRLYLETHPQLLWKEGKESSEPSRLSETRSTSLYTSDKNLRRKNPMGVSDEGTYGDPYEGPSQPEISQSLNYPSLHSVRKHGKVLQNPYVSSKDIPQGPQNENQEPFWENYARDGQNDGVDPQEFPSMDFEDETPRRWKRHVGPHDAEGIQRLISTGTLARPLSKWKEDGIDFIFATYWFYPAKTQIILPQTKTCIEEKMLKEGQRFEESNGYFGMDHDQYVDTVTKECLRDVEGQGEDGVYDSQSTYDPYDLHMGQMSVYRLHISCKCGSPSQNGRCGRILPFEEQPWTGYMGAKGDSYFSNK